MIVPGYKGLGDGRLGREGFCGKVDSKHHWRMNGISGGVASFSGDLPPASEGRMTNILLTTVFANSWTRPKRQCLRSEYRQPKRKQAVECGGKGNLKEKDGRCDHGS